MASRALVSQFVTDTAARTALFAEIARRLRPAGLLVSADLALPSGTSESDDPMALWIATMRYNGLDESRLAEYRDAMARSVAVLPARRVESIIADAGFRPPVRCYQAVLMHAWHTRRRAS